jgi:predicted acylesterase/phospholipase RssA
MQTALVLAGGGTKAAFQAGVIEQLDKKGLKFDRTYGTSAGAINAALYASGGSRAVRDAWMAKLNKRSDIFGIKWSTLFGFGNGIFHSKPLGKLLDELLDRPSHTNKAMATITSVHAASGDIIYNQSDEGSRAYWIEAIRASAAIPAICEPVKGCIDGGVRENTPVGKAIKDGAERIVVILNQPWYETRDLWQESTFLPVVDYAMRAFELMWHEMLVNDLMQCMKINDSVVNMPGVTRISDNSKKFIELAIYAPGRDILGTLEFDKKKIVRAIEVGEGINPVTINFEL